ncbi:MAG: Hsp33 family molecular chaperone HslO [Deltaproteobacteria bacterium]|nr:Hsp33 family molecular chaperone HslO [Deltaproteobacteria bacterium]
MSSDLLLPGVIRGAELVVAVATTTEVCRAAQAVHELAPTSSVALGRLISAASLSSLLVQKPGITSLQIVCSGRLGQAFAEVTHRGAIRGYVKNPRLDLPLIAPPDQEPRRSIALGIGDGLLAVTREAVDTHFTQSTVPLISGEIDLDVEHFCVTSDQIPTALACDVLLDDDGAVALAGGLIVQAMPGADLDRLRQLRAQLIDGELARLLDHHAGDAADMLRALVPEVVAVARPLELEWRCRCSYQRVLDALALLSPDELGQMAEMGEAASINCDFCRKSYEVSAFELLRLYHSAGKAEG